MKTKPRTKSGEEQQHHVHPVQLMLFGEPPRASKTERVALKWKAAATLKKLGWSCQMIGNAIDTNKGHVSRMVRGIRRKAS
jgi:hypothetical protein